MEKTARRKVTPRQAMSARHVDRVEKELLLIRAAVTRLIDSLRRSEKR